MSIRHLTDEELDLVLCGETLDPEQAAHLRDCVACRRRRDGFLEAMEGACGADPDEASRARVREAALAGWQSKPTVHWWRWMAAAAVVVLALGTLVFRQQPAPMVVDTEAVMAEVDEALARDPLAALASDEMVSVLIPVVRTTGEGSQS